MVRRINVCEMHHKYYKANRKVLEKLADEIGTDLLVEGDEEVEVVCSEQTLVKLNMNRMIICRKDGECPYQQRYDLIKKEE